MQKNLKQIWLCLLVFFFFFSSAQACHEGGPMGFAKRDPGMFSVDVTSSSTFIFASTSGTSGCKNWDFVEHWKTTRKKYLMAQWQQLSEEAATGNGVHLNALAHLLGCSTQQYEPFATLLHKNYASLFNRTAVSSEASFEQFLDEIDQLLTQQQTLDAACRSQSNQPAHS